MGDGPAYPVTTIIIVNKAIINLLRWRTIPANSGVLNEIRGQLDTFPNIIRRIVMISPIPIASFSEAQLNLWAFK
jgi:hypothetical protein